MEKRKSVNDRLKNIKLQTNVNKNSLAAKSKVSETNSEEYPKLRKPKASTWLKIQARQKTTDNIAKPPIQSVSGLEVQEEKHFQVPLRQEFLNKKQQLENATTKLLKKYEVRKTQGRLLDDDRFSLDSEQADEPLTLHPKLDLQFKDLKLVKKDVNKSAKVDHKELNFLEQHLVNILYTKVQAHPNGFFAENLPLWYKKTFDKEIAKGWLELLERSRKFYIEDVQNKTVLYSRECEEDCKDPKASGDGSYKDHEAAQESAVGFVRYKHLQKSLKEYEQNAGRVLANERKTKDNFVKPSDRLNKFSLNKKYNLVKK